MPSTIDGLTVQGNLLVTGTRNPPLSRSEVAQEANAVYPIPWVDFRVWDAITTNLPGTSATDDLGLIGGTFGTNTPSIQTSDLKTAGSTTRYARVQVQLPPEYQAGETVSVRLHAGMLTHVADVSATLDVECYKSDRERGVSADLCATAAQSINSLTLASKTFIITSTSLTPGDVLDIRLTMVVNDAASATAVIGCIGEAAMLFDIQG